MVQQTKKNRLARLLQLLELYERETDPVRKHWCGLRILRIGVPEALEPNQSASC